MINLPPFPAGRRLLLPLLLACAVCLSGCGGQGAAVSAEAKPQRGGTIVIGSISDVDSWNELLSQQTFASDLLSRIYLRLADPLGDSRDHPPTYEPSLAESWKFSEDRLSLTFHLRQATWSDGTPITASDVRFTWTAQTSPEVAWAGASGKEHVKDVEVEDEQSVTFRFDRVYPDAFTDAVEGGILPEHVFGAVPFAQWRTHDWSEAKIASGPFRLARHAPGEQITLERNPRYFKEGFPLAEQLVVRIVPDAANLTTQLLAGGVDYMEGIAPKDAARVRAEKGITLLPFDEPKYDYIGWNGSKKPFEEREVRRALSLAIDRKAIVEDMLYGFGRVSRGPILSFWWGADKTLEPSPYDPAEAKRVLARAGFAPGKEGVLTRDGAPLEFELTTNAGNRLREAVLVKVQEQLARVGITAHPRPLEMKTFRQQNAAGAYDAYLGGWRFSGKIDLKSIFGSQAVPPHGNNVVFYRSSELDGLLDELDTPPEWMAMRASLGRIERQLREDAPYTFLYETQRLAAAGPRLHGVRIDVPSDPLRHIETYWVGP